MKKILLGLVAAAALLATSCDKNLQEGPVAADGTAKVSVSISLPDIQTRVYSNGKTATKLQYAVYMKDGETLALLKGFTKTNETIDIKKEIDFQLVTGHKYAFVFWAGSEDAPYTVNFNDDGATMTANYAGVKANDETLDAFYTYKELEVKGDVEMQAELFRPFAQINVGTNDFAAAKSAGYEPTKSHITVSKVYSTLDLVSGDVTDAGEVEFTYAPIPTEETFPVVADPKYDYMVMAYALVANDQELVEVSFDCSTDVDQIRRGAYTVGSVPVQRNFRTNLFGQLLTSNAKVYVEIKPAYEQPDNDINIIADGVEFDEETNTFSISSAAGLEWLSYQVNGHGPSASVTATQQTYGAANVSFSGQTVVLACDIDMQGRDWTPIGYETKDNGASIYAFAGTFDGQNHIISNLTVSTEKNSNAGLFGATNRATIKNVTLKDVTINSHYKTGAIVGDGYNALIENCHVEGGTITVTPWEIKPGVYDDANNVGGIAGYLVGQPLEAHAKGCTVDGLTITAFRKVGGIAGVAHAADDANPRTCWVEIANCTVSNTSITADMTETRYDGYANRKPEIGKIAGAITDDNKPTGPRYQVEDNGNIAEDNVTLETKQAKIVGASDAAAAIKAGGNVFLTESVSSQNGYTMTKDANINLNNNSLSAKSNGTYGDNIVIGNGATVTISNGEIKPADDASVGNASATIIVKTASESHLTLNNVKATGIYPVYLNSANENSTVTINGGEYYTTMPLEGVDSDHMAPAVYVAKGSTGSTIGGKVTINGGTFGSKGVVNNFLLNIEDVLRKQEGKEPRNFIEVFGGKFYNFDPSNNKAEGEGTNFVADGYTVVSYADGEDTIYEVVAKE